MFTPRKKRGRPATVKRVPHRAHVHYIKCEDHYRLWRSCDSSDVFDVIPIQNFERQRLANVQASPERYIEGFPQDDEGNTVCPLCIANGD